MIKIDKILLFIVFLACQSTIIYSQNKSFEDGVKYLSSFIASKEFNQIKDPDIYLVDTVFNRALKFYYGDISETLLALTFSTLPFNKMPVTIPFTNVRISLKLPSVRDSLFEVKKQNLPGIIYFDSDLIGNQDKDKVAHFFGNAFLEYNVSFINLSKFFGLFVEIFESTFKVSGGIDLRDIQSNHLGEFFGNSLKKNKYLLPSDFFKVYSLFYFSYY